MDEQKLIETNLRSVRMYFEGDPSRGLENLECWDEVCDPDLEMIGGGLNDFPGIHGLKAYKEFIGEQHKRIDRKITILQMVADKESVAVRWRGEVVTKDKVFFPGFGIPKGKALTVDGVSFCAMRDGKVLNEWAAPDGFGMMMRFSLPMAIMMLISERRAAKKAKKLQSSVV